MIAIKRLLSVAVLVGLACAATLAQAKDPLVGTWKLNPEKSKGGYKSGTSVFEAAGDGVKATVDLVGTDGTAYHWTFTAKYDGKDNPTKPMLDGKPNPNAADAVAYKKIDDFTYEATTKLKGKTLTVARHVISKDGKTRTVTTTGTNAQGQKVNDTTVFEKQ